VALSKQAALDAAKYILAGPRSAESARLERIWQALQPPPLPGAYVASVQIPDDAPALMKELARKSETNYLPLLVKTFAQVMKVDGYTSASDPDRVDPWFWWQRARMDARQTGLVRSALQYGAAYATALPGSYGRGEPGPAISLYSPREMTALYADPEADEWPIMALSVDGDHVNLYDEELVYRFGIENRRPALPPPAFSVSLAGRNLVFLDTLEHGTGVCPVVRYRDRNLLAGEEQYGIVEPLITVAERITEHTFQAMVNDYFTAFKQRYVLGWVPASEQEELKAGAARIWYLDEDPANVTIGQLDSGDSGGVLKSREAAIRDFASMGQIPAQALGVDGISNISDATLAGLEAAKNRESDEITTSLGESDEQLLRLCAFIDGNEAAANDYASEIRWKNFEARSYAQTIDGLVKLVQGLDLDPAIALEDVPGMTEQRLKRAIGAIDATRARNAAAARVEAPASPTAPVEG
jgi:hypothetical protein